MSNERRSSAINTRKRSDFFHFDRCFKFLDHDIFTLSFKGNGRLYSTKVRELRKTGNDYFEKNRYFNKNSQYVCDGCIQYVRNQLQISE